MRRVAISLVVLILIVNFTLFDLSFSEEQIPNETTTGFCYPIIFNKEDLSKMAGFLATPYTKPAYSSGEYHLGTDIKANLGDKVFSIANKGIVELIVGPDHGYGPGNYSVTIKYKTAKGKEFWALFAHVTNLKVKVGQEVNAGYIIGEIGYWYRGNHLHFGINTDYLPRYPQGIGQLPSDYHPGDPLDLMGFVNPIIWIETKYPELDIEKLKTQADELPKNGKIIDFYIPWASVANSCPKPGDKLIIIEDDQAIALVELLEKSWGDYKKLWFKAKICQGDFTPNIDYNFINLSELPEIPPTDNSIDKKKIKGEALNLPDSKGKIYLIFWWSEVRELAPKPGDWFIHYNDDGEALGVTELTSEVQSLKEGLKFNHKIIKGSIPTTGIFHSIRVSENK